jgi:hypothetical protein
MLAERLTVTSCRLKEERLTARRRKRLEAVNLYVYNPSGFTCSSQPLGSGYWL